MNTAKKILIIFAVCLIATAFSACSQKKADTDTAPESTKFQVPATASPNLSVNTDIDSAIVVTDMKGREITLSHPAERAVVLTAGECEIVYALGAGDQLSGRGEYCDYPVEALDVEMVPSGAQTNIEKILELEPDVVITSTMAQSMEQVEQLETSGVPVVVVTPQSISNVYDSITLIGQVFDKADEAEALISDMKSSFSEISDKAKNESGSDNKTVYFEVSPLEYDLWAAGNNTFMDEIAQLLCLTNIFNDVDGWGKISQEQVIERNPDFIVTSSMYSGGPRPEEEIAGRSGWGDMSAVKSGKIFHADSDEITRPGPRLVNAAEMLFEMIYG